MLNICAVGMQLKQITTSRESQPAVYVEHAAAGAHILTAFCGQDETIVMHTLDAFNEFVISSRTAVYYKRTPEIGQAM
uniref:Arginine decarboxylase n=1 Tax=Ascaris lumbricoides TaxID=6252 RepID=A0A0M3IQB6_ASCLU